MPTLTDMPDLLQSEILYLSTRTRVTRGRLQGRNVIVKEYLGPDAARRLGHESALLRRLDSIAGVPQLLPALSSAQTMVMQDLGGQPLAAVGRLEGQPLLDLALQIAGHLAAVHSAGVIHKDISPHNVVVSLDLKQAWLIDFDLSTTFAEERPSFVHHNQMAGTLPFMSPEQTGRVGHTVDQRTDLYSLGATLYHLACGHAPFQRADPLELIHDILATQPTPAHQVNAGCPRTFSEVLTRLLQKEPDKRYQSADGLRLDLESLQVGRPLERPGGREFPLRLSAPSRLVGRDAELAVLRQSLQDCIRFGPRGLLVGGEPGIGKTALIDQLKPLVTAERGWFVAGKFDQYRHDTASVTHQVFAALGSMLLAEPEQALAQQRQQLMKLGPQLTGLVASSAQEFCWILGEQPQPGPAQDPVEFERALRGATVELFRLLAKPGRPLVVFFDDVQWAGPGALALMDTLLDQSELPGLLVVCACRPASEGASLHLTGFLQRWRDRPGCTRLELSALPPPALGAFLRETLRQEPDRPEVLAEFALQQTGGNPYGTVEWLNALRREQLLRPGPSGWTWDEAQVRSYVGDVGHLLARRIARLPRRSADLLSRAALLSGEPEVALLQDATGLEEARIQRDLQPILEDGLMVYQRLPRPRLYFRHDRVQQAAVARLNDRSAGQLQRRLALRLAALPGRRLEAAAQFLDALEFLRPRDDRELVQNLLEEAAVKAEQAADFARAARFWSAARGLCPADSERHLALDMSLHRSLYGCGRLEEADRLFADIQEACPDTCRLAESACVQLSSLCQRRQPQKAVDLGLQLLQMLGLRRPPEAELLPYLRKRAARLGLWVERHRAGPELEPESSDPRAQALAKILNRILVPSLNCDLWTNAWVTLESQRIWDEFGACGALLGTMAAAGRVVLMLTQDFRACYDICRCAMRVAVARGHAAEAAFARFIFVSDGVPWFEPLENNLLYCERLQEELVQAGDLQLAGLVGFGQLMTMLDCCSLETLLLQTESEAKFGRRTGNAVTLLQAEVYRRLALALRGEGARPEEIVSRNPQCRGDDVLELVVERHTLCILSLICQDDQRLFEHSEASLAGYAAVQSFYYGAMLRLFHSLALVRRMPHASDEQLRQLDDSRSWLAERARHAPWNFLHLYHFLEAELAASCDRCWDAANFFEKALESLEPGQRPWHRAVIAESAGRFYWRRGLRQNGCQHLRAARDDYASWGATARVKALEGEFTFLVQAPEFKAGSSVVSADVLDLAAILRASQALSSETNLDCLNRRLVGLLQSLTGATHVHLVLADGAGWFLPVGPSLEEAAEMGQLSIRAFRYVERSLQPLLVDDATTDPRFRDDPCWRDQDGCSLMVLPILHQGNLRAILMLENHLSRGAFTASRLDAVQLIAGQLAVSLENALQYRLLESKVEERTRQLATSLSLVEATLESTTDGIAVTDSEGRMVGHNEQFLQMWRLPAEIVSAGNEAAVIERVAPQLKDPQQFADKVVRLLGEQDQDSFDVLEFRDGRVFERYSKPRRCNGAYMGRVWSFRDITLRRRAENELDRVHHQLLEASRLGGMAEVATNVLHNVGNVLNSVNVSAGLLETRLRQTRLTGLGRVVALLEAHQADLADFLAGPQGSHLRTYLQELADYAVKEQADMLTEIESLRHNVDHVKTVVALQQSYARTSGLSEPLDPSQLFEDSLKIQNAQAGVSGIEFVRDYASLPPLLLEKHKVMQILINLISNACNSCVESGRRDKQVRLSLRLEHGRVRFGVADNGVGIARENQTRIFAFGFTTRPEGHGFGLHSGSLAAREMGGCLEVSSPGPRCGAIATLELPARMV